jgi:hypothetical protein
MWSGTLTVPQGGIYNTGEESAVFAVLQSLDRAYRRLPAAEAAPEGALKETAVDTGVCA